MKDVIANVLDTIPQSRDDDACLIYNVWLAMQDEGDPPIPDYVYTLLKKFYPDSITRIRRMYQKAGMYPASEAKQKQRRHEQVVMAFRLGAPDKDYPIWRDGKNGEYGILPQDMHIEYLKNCIKFINDRGYSTESERLINNAWLLILETEMERRNKLF